jgi:hypothetical protein
VDEGGRALTGSSRFRERRRELLGVSYERLWEQPVSVLAELLRATA